MTHSVNAWTHPDCYIGETWEGWFSAGFGQSRDSDALERSNFTVASKRLLALAETLSTETHNIPGALDDEPSVQIVREGHWAVGWIEWIAIHQTNEKALTLARELCERANDYPVLDEDDLSRVEDDEAQEIWSNCYDTAERIEYIREHRSQFEFRGFADLIGCVRGKYFAGYASELIRR